jgi:hypothetical protein
MSSVITTTAAGRRAPSTALPSFASAAVLLSIVGWFRVAHLWSNQWPAPLLYLALAMARVPKGAWFLSGPLLLLAWAPQLLRGSSTIPLRSRVALGILTALTLFHLWASWEYAVSYRGWFGVSAIALASAGPVAFLWFLLRVVVRRPSFWGNLLFHLGLVAWLIVLAFPDIGELV